MTQPAPRPAVAIAAGLALLALAQGLVDPSGAFGGPLESGLVGRNVYDVVLVASAVLLAFRPILVREQRLAWSFMAAGLALWAAGDLYFTLIGDSAGAGSYPSVSDIFFVACYPFMTVGVIALARENLRGQTNLILLDGLTAALATTSLALALLSGPATELFDASTSAYAPTIAYPVCDFVLLAFAVGALAMSGKAWRRIWLFTALGWALAGAADAIHVYDAADGGYQFGSAYDFLWPLSTVMIAWAGWQGTGAGASAPIRFGARFAFPSLFALPALAVLVYDHFARVGVVPLVLATATIVLVFVRVAIALHHLGLAHESQLRRSERDAQSRRLEALGQLAGGVAHDFNNLLAVILNYAHFLAESLPEGDARRDDAKEIGLTAERAAKLAHQLLLFSRRDMTPPELVQVGPTLAAMETMLRTTVSERVDVRLLVGDDLPPVRLAPGQFDQILLNLAVNARDAMPKGGQLAVFADVVGEQELPGEPRLATSRYVRVTVRDTGAGMSEQVQERAFEPFFSTKSVGHGTGLGLATVYGIVEHAGGAIEIRSREGIGTSVIVYLPAAAQVDEASDRDRGDTSLRGAAEQILLVEDECSLRISTSRILTSNGYEVLEASDGEDALTLAAETDRPIDLLITDVVMPNLSGVELAKRLHVDKRGIPVIYMSGHPAQLLDDEGPFDGRGALLMKPVTGAELLGAVRSALGARPVAATDQTVGSASS
jgi:two-component system cell cycle sensor histidine kinase/response regulator CckA